MRRIPLFALLILAFSGCLPQAAEEKEEGKPGAEATGSEENVPVCEASEVAPEPAKKAVELVPLKMKERPTLANAKLAEPKPAQLPVDNAPKGPAPVIGCDKPAHDYGTVSQGDDVKHTFVVKNTGEGPLTITRADGG